jgi:hypothetical protein
MKRTLLACFWLSAYAFPALADENRLELPLNEILDLPQAKEDAGIDGSVSFYFGNAWLLRKDYTPVGSFGNRDGRDVISKGTNSKLYETKEEACQDVMTGVLRDAQRIAKRKRANAVFFMASYYKVDPLTIRASRGGLESGFISEDKYVCRSAWMNTNVTYEVIFANEGVPVVEPEAG